MSAHHKYPARVPRFAAGIRAQSSRGGKATWWTKRWIASLEAMRLGSRLGRGKSYALSGQVISMKIEGPKVTAAVQGSRENPYTIELEFSHAEGDVYEAIASALKREPMLLARLLVGDLPTEVESFFVERGVNFFPKTGKDEKGNYDIRMKCSCPDWMRPCKHIAAILVLLGEEIARNPSTLVALRGVEIEELMESAEQSPAIESSASARASENAQPIAIESDPKSMLTRLGPVPFWRGTEKCVETLGRIYDRVKPVAIDGVEGAIDLRDLNERTRVTGGDMKIQTRALTPAL